MSLSSPSRLLFVLACIPLGSAAAQKIPLGGADPRVVQLHDVGDLVRDPRRADRDVDEEILGWEREQLTRLEQFVRVFVDPPLQSDDDIRALGQRHLVLLGRPEQQAWLEQLLVQHRRAGAYQILLNIRILEIPKPTFHQHLAQLYPEGETWKPLQTVLGPGRDTEALITGLLKAPGVQVLQAPKLITLPLQRAEIRIGEKLRYVKDFEVEFVRGRAVPNPVFDEILNGTLVDATSGLIGNDMLGVTFDFTQCDVELPIRKFETSLAGSDDKLVLDLPTHKSVHLRQNLRLPDGGTALVTAPNNDRYAAALVTARIVGR